MVAKKSNESLGAVPIQVRPLYDVTVHVVSGAAGCYSERTISITHLSARHNQCTGCLKYGIEGGLVDLK